METAQNSCNAEINAILDLSLSINEINRQGRCQIEAHGEFYGIEGPKIFFCILGCHGNQIFFENCRNISVVSMETIYLLCPLHLFFIQNSSFH